MKMDPPNDREKGVNDDDIDGAHGAGNDNAHFVDKENDSDREGHEWLRDPRVEDLIRQAQQKERDMYIKERAGYY